MKRMITFLLNACFAVSGFALAVFAILSPLRLRFWVSKILEPVSVGILKHVSILRDVFIKRKGDI